LDYFIASNRWLEIYRKRHNISFKSIYEESAAIDRKAVDDWKTTTLQNIIEKYAVQDIFNADETGLFIQILPNNTMAFKNKHAVVEKCQKNGRLCFCAVIS